MYLHAVLLIRAFRVVMVMLSCGENPVRIRLFDPRSGILVSEMVTGDGRGWYRADDQEKR